VYLATEALDSDPQIAELSNQVKEAKETVKVLVSQITMLRSELISKKRREDKRREKGVVVEILL
jgi:hypothetical protein